MKCCIKLFLITLLFFISNKMFAAEMTLLEQNIKKICQTQALEQLKTGNLASFDALVGECACQVRAVKIVSIYSNFLRVGIENLTAEELEFLTLSYLLTVAKGKRNDRSPVVLDFKHKFTINEETSYKYLQKITPDKLTYKPGTALIQAAQRRLAELSVKFLQELAKKRSDKELISALSYTLFDRDETCLKREHCGYYPSMKILLNYILSEGYAIGLYIQSINPEDLKVHKLYYKPKNGILTFIYEDEINDNDPILIIQGHSALVNDQENGLREIQPIFSKLGIEDIILANFAAHPQFAGKQKSSDIPYEKLGIFNLLEQKNQHHSFAETHGCSLDNMNLFFLNHIYATTGKLR